MKKTSKKILSLILSLLMVLTAFPAVTVYSEESKQTCPKCFGKGTIDCSSCLSGSAQCKDCFGEDPLCETCSGTGFVICTKCEGVGEVKCTTCDGEGEFDYRNKDKDKPEFSKLDNADEFWVKEKTDIKGKVKDVGTKIDGFVYTSGISKVEIVKSSKPDERTEIKYNLSTEEYSFEVEPVDEEYTIYATDDAGNEAKYTINVKADIDLPVLEDVKADKTDWTNEKIIISGKASDETSKIVSIDYKKADDVSFSKISKITYDETGKSASFELELPAQNYEGDYVIHCIDEAGNVSQEANIAVKMDSAVSSVVSVNVSPEGWTKDDVIINGEYNDNLSGISKFEYKKADEETFLEITNVTYDKTGKSASFELKISAQCYEGDYEIRCFDKAGNVTDNKIVSVKMDNEKPSLEINEYTSDWVKEITVLGKALDSTSKIVSVEYKRADEEAFSQITFDKNGEFKLTFSDQSYEGDYYIHCVDEAGNVSEDKTISLKTDSEAPTDLAISYSKPVISIIIEKITFGYYKAQCNVTITAKDNLSGVKEFKVIADDPENPIVLDEIEIDGDNYKSTFKIAPQFEGCLSVTAVDKAGNKSEEYSDSDNYNIVDDIAPVVNIKVNPSENKSETKEDVRYFNVDKREYQIDIIEHNFVLACEEKDFLNFDIIAENVVGDSVKTEEIDNIKNQIYDLNNWSVDVENKDLHTFKFECYADANYKLVIGYTDPSGNEGQVNYVVDSDESVDAPNEFSLDQTAPESIKFNFKASTVKKILNILTFGVFFNDNKINLDVNAIDETSGLWKAELKVLSIDNKEVIFEDSVGFDDPHSGTAAFKIDIDSSIKDFKGNVEIKVYDKSGNVYENSGSIEYGKITLQDGINPIDDETQSEIKNLLIYENTDSHIENSSIIITPSKDYISEESRQAEANLTKYIKDTFVEDAEMSYFGNAVLYNDKVEYTVDFEDLYSGISKSQIIVFNNNTKEEYINSTFDSINGDDGKIVWKSQKSEDNDDLYSSAKAMFSVDENVNDIIILSILTDNAGNVSYDYYNFGIDKTAPAIKYNFVTNGKSTTNGSYNSKETTFIINVYERNLPLDDEFVGKISYKVNGVEKSKNLYGKDFILTSEDPVYSDDQEYTFVLDTLKDEGQYEDFKFEAEDKAKNSSSVAPKLTFFYDYTLPVITIKSDKHSTVANTYFYQDSREITVTVTDRYFNEQSFKFNNKSGTYKFIGDSEQNQKYHTNNRTFTYVFTYTTSTSIDCELTRFAATDFSGNSAVNVPTVVNGARFVVDGKTPQNFTATVVTTKNKRGVNVSGKDYNVFVEDDVVLTITCEDENLTYANISSANLLCKSLTSNGTTKDIVFNLKKVQSDRNKLVYSISNLDQDGFYELSYTVTDDSGKTSTVQNVSFAICRNGALFNNDDLEKISSSGSVYNADNVNSISFKQYSASANTLSVIEISSDSIQFPRRVLELGKDYIIDPKAQQNPETMVYTSVYKLLRHAFELENGAVMDGVYTIKLTPVTKDANDNESENAPSQTFTVTIDATDPVIVASLNYKTSYNKKFDNVVVESDASYKIFANTATLMFTVDDGYSGIDKETVEVVWNNEKLEYTIDENGYYVVELSSKDNANGNEIIIGVKDKAGNVVNTTFTVNLNNNFWLYVSLGGFAVIALIAIAIILIIRKKKIS